MSILFIFLVQQSERNGSVMIDIDQHSSVNWPLQPEKSLRTTDYDQTRHQSLSGEKLMCIRDCFGSWRIDPYDFIQFHWMLGTFWNLSCGPLEERYLVVQLCKLSSFRKSEHSASKQNPTRKGPCLQLVFMKVLRSRISQEVIWCHYVSMSNLSVCHTVYCIIHTIGVLHLLSISHTSSYKKDTEKWDMLSVLCILFCVHKFRAPLPIPLPKAELPKDCDANLTPGKATPVAMRLKCEPCLWRSAAKARGSQTTWTWSSVFRGLQFCSLSE